MLIYLLHASLRTEATWRQPYLFPIKYSASPESQVGLGLFHNGFLFPGEFWLYFFFSLSLLLWQPIWRLWLQTLHAVFALYIGVLAEKQKHKMGFTTWASRNWKGVQLHPPFFSCSTCDGAFNWQAKAGAGRKGAFQPAHVNQKPQEAHWDIMKFPFGAEIESI